MDIVERLRGMVGVYIGDADIDDDLNNAADEIERLRKALNDCIYYLAMEGAIEGSLRVIEIASAALQQKDSE